MSSRFRHSIWPGAVNWILTHSSLVAYGLSALVFITLTAIWLSSKDSHRYLSLQWDYRDGRYVYSIDGAIFMHEGAHKDVQIAKGGAPCFAESTSDILFVADGRFLKRSGAPSTVLVSVPKGQTIFDVAFDPSGRTVYYSVYTERGIIRPSGHDLYRCKLDGSDIRQLTGLNFWSLHMGTQPFLGGKIAIVVDDPERGHDQWSGRGRVALVDPNATDSITYPRTAIDDLWSIACSPSGESAVEAGYKDGYTFFLGTLSGGLTKLPLNQDGIEWPLFTEDGAVAYLQQRGGKAAAWRINRAGTATMLFPLAG